MNLPDPKEFRTVWGLSCVENQVMLYLRQLNFDYRFVFEDSLLSLSEMEDRIFCQKKRYVDPGMVPRLQDQLRKRGILELNKHCEGLDALLEWAHEDDNKGICLMQITPDFSLNILHARGWRGDHFIRLQNNGGLNVLNDIPPLLISILPDELKRAYAGTFLSIRLVRRDGMIAQNPAAFERLRSHQREKTNSEDGFIPTGREVYELLLCYRVLRWRAREYASLFMNVDKIDDCLRNVEKLQMKAAYNLLHDAGVTETGNILNTLRKLDRSLTDSIRQS